MKEYDFALNWITKDKEAFVDELQFSCRKKKLSFLWVSEENVKDIIRRLISGKTRIKFLLDTEATYNKEGDDYAKVCYGVKDCRGVVVNDPDKARLATDKSVTHYSLLKADITVPYSIIIRSWEPQSFRLTRSEKEKLGSHFIIKPACGYSKLGVVKNAKGLAKEISGARKFDKEDNFLLQEKVNPISLKDKRAWFRVFHLFDKIIPCWWDDNTSFYKQLNDREFNSFRLSDLAKITSQIAAITKMLWFSTEIAIDNKKGRNRFVVVDYVNDQCDMTPQSKDKTGVPDRIVEFTAKHMVECAQKLINKKPIKDDYTVWLKNKNLSLRGLGNPNALLN